MKAGAQAEQTAAQFLQRQGLRLVQTNFHCCFGEIDLILQEGATLVFAEVRLRSRSDFGGAAASMAEASCNSNGCGAWTSWRGSPRRPRRGPLGAAWDSKSALDSKAALRAGGLGRGMKGLGGSAGQG